MSYPRIASNVRRNERTMHVEYVFRDGRRAIVHVPYDRWINQGHAGVGDALQTFLDELDLQRARLTAKLPS